MKPLFVHYPKCGTCRKAAKWLADHGVDVEARDIVADRPTAGELARWQAASGRPVQKFFNTSGLLYKELGLKDKLPALSDEAMIELLATDENSDRIGEISLNEDGNAELHFQLWKGTEKQNPENWLR